MRVASVIRLRPEHEEAYRELHRAAWPEVLAALTRAHVRNYSIFLRDGLLFSYLEYVGDDYAADMDAIAADEATRRWWELTDPCQQPLDSAAKGSGGHPPRNYFTLTKVPDVPLMNGSIMVMPAGYALSKAGSSAAASAGRLHARSGPAGQGARLDQGEHRRIVGGGHAVTAQQVRSPGDGAAIGSAGAGRLLAGAGPPGGDGRGGAATVSSRRSPRYRPRRRRRGCLRR